MPISRDKNYYYIFFAFLLLTILYLIAEYILTGHKMGVPLDDTWIHYRFAENFSKGLFFQYNIGEPTPGSTSPLWVVLLSISFLISPNIFIPFSIFLGSIFFLLTCFEVYKLSIKLGFNINYTLTITFLTLICGRLIWSSLSGMEITLFTYLSLLAVRMHLKELESKKINIWTGIILGLSIAARPESYLLSGIYYLATIIIFRKKFKENFSHLVISLILFLIIIAPYPIFCLIARGSLLPNTFKGQDAGLRFVPDMVYVRESLRLFFRDNILLTLLWIVGSIYFTYTFFTNKTNKKYLLINLWVILLPAISAFVAPVWRHHGRYLIPLIPFTYFVAINIFEKIINWVKDRYRKNSILLTRLSFTILFLTSSVYTVVYGRAIGWNTDNINEQQIGIANWLNKNLPDEKCFGINDIGAITFIANRRIVDMEGLITPDVLDIKKTPSEIGDKKMMEILKKNSVNYLAIYPEWYPTLMEKYSKNLEKIYSIRLENNTICGEDEAVVYKIHWENINLN